MANAFKVGLSHQREIYESGFFGKRSLIPQNFLQLEELCRKKLAKPHFDYIYTGAGQNDAVKNNSTGFSRYHIIPRVLSGVSEPSMKIKLLNVQLNYPVLFAPVGVLELAHPKADLELAKASSVSGIPMIISNQASFPMEEISNELKGCPHYFQLYFSRSNALTESLVRRAEKCGCKGIVLTLDTTSLGWRHLDLENGYLPFLEGRGIANYTSDPVFRDLMNEASTFPSAKRLPSFYSLIKLYNSYPDSFLRNLRSGNPVKAVRTFIQTYSRPELSWKDVHWLRSLTKLPILLKGILHREDALKAVEAGIDGIIISNHGGRQIDRAIPSIAALIDIKSVVPESYPLLLDSGIRSGTDLFIALAAGANAVCLGRPYVYALAIAGHEGVQELTSNYLTEFKIMMSLSGCARIEDISPAHIGLNHF